MLSCSFFIESLSQKAFTELKILQF